MINVDKVVDYIHAHWKRLPKKPCLDGDDSNFADFLLEALNSAANGNFEIFKEEFFTEFEEDTKDMNWSPEDEEYHQLNVYNDVEDLPGQPNMIQFSKGEFVHLDKVEEAVEFYGSKSGVTNSGARIRPSFETMKSRFRFIKNSHHLQKIRNYEATKTIKFDRANNLKFISNELGNDVKKHLEDGKILQDSTLRFLIVDIINRNKLDIRFDASDDWILKWKKGFGLSSRKITKFVTNIRHQNRDQIEQESKDFVNQTNQILPFYPSSSVFNADQSGFQLEMYSARTLAMTGSKHVPCVVQNVSSTTHAYTVLPLVSAAGILHKTLFITLKERNGKFPKKGHFKAPNIFVTCHTSHIMTKNLMKTFFEEVVFEPSMPKDALLLVDSWTSWKDQSAIDSVTPPTNHLVVRVIPPGCTGMVQPCDVGIFGSFKKVVKMITAHGQLMYPKYKIYARDETLKLLSLVWWQLCSPKLQPWAQYAWYACGYDVPRPPYFQTPAQYLFPKKVSQECHGNGCSKTSFIKCIYCEEHFCFHHFVLVHHRCC
ncbi:hypothetical protein B9Z55_020716 [Caenorhabditis nigoni]|uniref:DDE-1 domain-containing protein n=1 Tax=Caenorhabditis nigoni TaxID=1611254 RepID=A0A2G5TNS9_9PELO|nr:hypothetical protein B9Z55_020716 [Caenorhabditis nigoni]